MTRFSFGPRGLTSSRDSARTGNRRRPLHTAILAGMVLGFPASDALGKEKPHMILVPSGTFTMGSPYFESGHEADEDAVSVTLTRPFHLSDTEVTQALWLDVMGTRPSHYSGYSKWGGERPVEKVSWLDCIRFCNELSSREGYSRCYEIHDDDVIWDRDCDGYRLPTEAEWEYAARAGSTGPFSTGDTLAATSANYDWEHPYLSSVPGQKVLDQRHRSTTGVRSFSPNAWGFFDMHGNVWEWCWDWMDAYPPGPLTDPSGPAMIPVEGTYRGSGARVTRGGSWIDHAVYCRSAQRWRFDPPARFGRIGFRIARSQERNNSDASPDARVVIETSHPGTRILLDDVEAGFTPLVLSVPPGKMHRIRVDDHRVAAEGFIEKAWNPAQIDTLRLQTTARLALLSITPHLRWGRPVPTKVEIDAVQTVTAPWVGELTVGRHELRWGKATRGVYVGGRDTVKVELRRNSPARSYRNSIGQQMEFVPHDKPRATGTTRQSKEMIPPPGLDHDLYVSATEVTQAQWSQLMERVPSHVLASDHPVERVSWVDGVTFCNALSVREGLTPVYTIVQASRAQERVAGSMQYAPTHPDVEWAPSNDGYRLLTEAEWNHVRWAGAPMPSTERANRLHSVPVGRFPATAHGLHDLIGNLHEWCWDLHRPMHRSDPPATPGSRIARGSSWLLHGDAEGLPDRYGFVPTHLDYDVGFRVAREVR